MSVPGKLDFPLAIQQVESVQVGSVLDINIKDTEEYKVIDINDAVLKKPSIIRIIGENKDIQYFRLINEMLHEMKQMKAQINDLEHEIKQMKSLITYLENGLRDVNKSTNIVNIPKMSDNKATEALSDNGTMMFYESENNECCKIAFRKSNGNKIQIML